jgi:hypothetical protein
MRSRALLTAALMCSSVLAFAKDQPEYHSAKVISQDVNSYNHGVAVVPLGNVIAGVPITRRSNIVTVETSKHRLTWSEAGKNTLILPVNETIQFYQDGNWFIVLDSKKKKHKFALIHAEALEGSHP